MLAITYTMEIKRITAAKWGITQTKKIKQYNNSHFGPIKSDNLEYKINKKNNQEIISTGILKC